MGCSNRSDSWNLFLWNHGVTDGNFMKTENKGFKLLQVGRDGIVHVLQFIVYLLFNSGMAYLIGDLLSFELSTVFLK